MTYDNSESHKKQGFNFSLSYSDKTCHSYTLPEEDTKNI